MNVKEVVAAEEVVNAKEVVATEEVVVVVSELAAIVFVIGEAIMNVTMSVGEVALSTTMRIVLKQVPRISIHSLQHSRT